jgi:predicted ribosomally synthesized peptide with SipW-like signal peptide
MKAKTIAISTILLIVLVVAGATMAWFTMRANADNKFNLGTVEVEVVENYPPVNEVKTNVDYTKEVSVRSLGSKNTYVRVRLVPEWSDPSLPVSNVVLNLSNIYDGTNGDWVANDDGYYYFRFYLTKDQTTSKLLGSVTFTELGPEYENAQFTLKVVAEGVQITHEAWRDVWELEDLPFTPEQPWGGE